MNLSGLKIKNKSDLKQILQFIEDQGFGYIADYELHNKKINGLVSKNNKLNINYNSNIKDKFKNIEDYDEIEKEIQKYFSQFSINDKIKEYIKKFHLVADDQGYTPWNTPNDKDVIEWIEFRDKYKLKDEFSGSREEVRYYNLDKNYLKIHFYGQSGWDFKFFYNAILGEECKEFDEKRVGVYQNIGKIEIKFFAKGGANIKGDLKKFKELYYNELLKDHYFHMIIKYNDKIKIYKKENKD